MGPIMGQYWLMPTLANGSLQYWSNIVTNIGPTVGRNIGPISCVTWVVSSDPAQIPNSKGNPFIGGYIYMRETGDFRQKSPFISETERDRPMVTVER